MAFSPGGQRIATGVAGFDGTVEFWSVGLPPQLTAQQMGRCGNVPIALLAIRAKPRQGSANPMVSTKQDWNLGIALADGGRPCYPGLDGLRALAIILVFGAHAQIGGFGCGFVGVDVFFVLSGFLIGGIVLDQLRDGRFRYGEYVKRRAVRILPPLACLLAGAAAVQLLANPAPWPRGIFWRSWLHGAAFTSNWYVFHGGGDACLSHLWSLSTEAQFYLGFPLLLGLAYRCRFLGGFFLGVAALVLFQSALLHWVFTGGHTRWAHGLNAWVLTRPEGWLLGALCAYGVRVLPMRHLGPVPTSVGVTLLAALALWSKADWRTAVGCTSVQWATVLVLMLSVKAPGSGLVRVLEWAPLRWVGRYSYGLYLWHLFVLQWVYGWGLPGWAWEPVSLGLAILLAVFTDRGGGRVGSQGGLRPAAALLDRGQ